MTINWELRRRRLAEYHARQRQLAEYFQDYANPNSDPQELQKRSHDLAITAKEWGEYHQRQIAAGEQF